MLVLVLLARQKVDLHNVRRHLESFVSSLSYPADMQINPVSGTIVGFYSPIYEFLESELKGKHFYWHDFVSTFCENDRPLQLKSK